MKESKEELNSEFYNACTICNKINLELKENSLENLNQNRKMKAILEGINISELIKKCNCNNSTNSYVHKYCILLKIIYNIEIKCDKCNAFYNIKINKIKKFDIGKIICYSIVFILIYIIHLFIYIECVFFILMKNSVDIKYYHVPIFFGCLLFLINTLILYFSIVNNIYHYKYLQNYKIDIFNINNNNNNNNKKNDHHFFELIYDFYMWFYGKSRTKILLEKNKKCLINRINNKDALNNYINEIDNKIFILKKDDANEKCEENIKIKYEENRYEENINNNNNIDKSNSNYLYNNNSLCKNESENPIDAFKQNILVLEQNNDQENKNFLDQLYSDRTGNNEEEEEKNNINNDKNVNQSNIIEMVNFKNNKKDYINININQIQGKNINININIKPDMNKNNLLNNSSNNNENNNVYNFRNSKIKSDNTGKTALIPNKNIMNKIMDDNNNNNNNNVKRKRQIKSIKLKQKDIKIKDKKIVGNIEENEEVDFSDIEKGKMDTKITKFTKEKINLIKVGGVNEIFKTKRSFQDVPLNISNPTESAIIDDTGNRSSLKRLKG